MAKGGGGFDVNALMKQAQQMQEQMLQAQEKLKDETVEASAGGGMVKVTMGGDLTLRSITIDPEAVAPEDVELLQDMVQAAVNDALRSAQDLAGSAMGDAEERKRFLSAVEKACSIGQKLRKLGRRPYGVVRIDSATGVHDWAADPVGNTKKIVQTFREQQRKESKGAYHFMRRTEVQSDTVAGRGFGNPAKPVWKESRRLIELVRAAGWWRLGRAIQTRPASQASNATITYSSTISGRRHEGRWYW